MTKHPKQRFHYQWTGINRSGQIITGGIEAQSIAAAQIQLRQQGLLIKKIIKKRRPLFDSTYKKITSRHITRFSRQLSTMIAAGIPLIQTFTIIAKGQTNQHLRKLVETIQKDVESGLTLTEALQKHPLFFNELFINLVNAGEKSGKLDIMLDKVASYKEKTEHIKRKIKKALTYPVAVMGIAFFVTMGLLLYVVPQFEALFKEFHADMPIFTRGVISISKYFQRYWLPIFGGLGSILYGIKYAHHHAARFRQSIDRLLLHTPVLGSLVQKTAIARFAHTLSITYAAGLPLVDALQAVAFATGNTLYAKATYDIGEALSKGLPLHQAIESTQLFPSMAIQMVTIGEESGTLEAMLSKVADYFDEEVNHTLETLSGLLEPLIMAILGLLIGGLIISMYLPLFKLGSVI